MTDTLPAHSPLGASGAPRWLPCPGSVGLSAGLEDPESEFAAEGTAAHELGEIAQQENRQAWQYVGKEFYGQRVTYDMAVAVDYYLTELRNRFADADFRWIEERFHCPDLHPFFYGTSDAGAYYKKERVLHVVDYKHGMGIPVFVKWHPQPLYYAAGALEKFDLWNDVDTVVVHVCQPRNPMVPPWQTWSLSTEELEDWLFDTLLPGMNKAMVSTDTKSGPWCRFCPARGYGCPQLLDDAEEFEALARKIIERTAAELTNEEIARYMDLEEVMKIAGKAARHTARGRIEHGRSIPGWKLVQGMKHRVLKNGGAAAAERQFGDDAFEPDKIKSVAELEKLPGGKEFARRWGFQPRGDLKVVKADDPKPAVTSDIKSYFKPKGRKKTNG